MLAWTAGGQRESELIMDVVGIGALNVDLIASASVMKQRLSETGEFGSLADRGTEREVSDEQLDGTLNRLGLASFVPSAGGSAFNTIHALAELDPSLELGMVGIAGHSPYAPVNLKELIGNLQIDEAFLRHDNTQWPGRCLSFIDNGERTLLTTQGANRSTVNFMDSERSELMKYLESSKIVHVTSLLDPDAPSFLASLLAEVRKDNPLTQLSFDPGYTWTKLLSEGNHGAAEVAQILRLSSFLFLNYAEFRLVGEYQDGESDDAVAARLFENYGNSCELVVLKKYEGVEIFRVEDGGRVACQTLRREPLAEPAIEDATGAGDVFAAGVLAASASVSLHGQLGVALGVNLARYKLRHVGSVSYSGFGHLGRQVVRKMVGQASDDALIGTFVFVDQIGSTDIARRYGNEVNEKRLEDFREKIESVVGQWHGMPARVVDFAGDGSFLIFENVSNAIECVKGIVVMLGQMSLPVRCGLHTGSYRVTENGYVSGLAVNAAARVAGMAAGGEIFCSRTSRDLLGDELRERCRFVRRESLKGLDEEWDLYQIVD